MAYSENLIFREDFKSDASVSANGWTKVGSGIIENGLHGDGSTYIERDEAFLPFSGSWTRRILINITAVQSAYVGIYANNASQGFDLGIQGTTVNQIFAFLRGGTSPATISDSHGGDFYGLEGQDVWITWTKSAGGTAKLYINDTLESTSAAAGDGLKPNSKIQIGARSGTSAIPTGYIIKQVEEYSIEFNADEIQDANAGTVYDIDRYEIDLPFYTQFNDGTNVVTRNFGTSGVNAILGDGTTSTTFPALLSPKGYKFDSTDYINTQININWLDTPFTIAWAFLAQGTSTLNIAGSSDTAQSFKGLRILDIPSSDRLVVQTFIDLSNSISLDFSGGRVAGLNILVFSNDGLRNSDSYTGILNSLKSTSAVGGSITSGSAELDKPFIIGGYWNGASPILSFTSSISYGFKYVPKHSTFLEMGRIAFELQNQINI